MPQVINTNVPSLNAQRNLNTSQSALATSLQRLSSGLRINSAKDDAAGLAITDRMTSQIRGLNQAARNANDGVSLAQTAEGGLSEVANNLQRIRELAVQSANATNTSSDRASLNAEVAQLVAEIQRVATSTQFNGQNILDGTFTAAQFQVGANANQTITASTGNAQASAIGAFQYNNSSSPVTGTALSAGDLTISGVDVGASSDGSADSIVNAINGVTSQTGVTATATSSIVATNTPTGKISLLSGDLVINGTNIGAVAGNYNLATQGASIATAINAKTTITGVTAAADVTTGAITLSSNVGETIAITSNNGTVGASRLENATGLEVSASTVSATASATITATAGSQTATGFVEGAGFQNLTFSVGTGGKLKTYQFVDAANVPAATALGTNIAIAFDSGLPTSQANFELAIKTAVEANNTSVTVTGNGAGGLTFTSKALGTLTVKDYNFAVGTSGTTAGADTAGTGVAEGGTLVIDGTTYTFVDNATASSVTSATAGTLGLRVANSGAIATNLAAAVTTAYGINTSDVTAAAVGSAVTFTSVLKGTPGNTAALATGTSVGSGVVAAPVVSATDGAYTASTTYGIISLSSNTSYSVAGNNPGKAGLFSASSTLNTVSAVDISTVTGANSAISVIDGALSQVATVRGNMGALQNRFTSVVASLTASSENLSAARSRIQDADFAAETAALTRNQILQQAGVAMLAQANALPQTVLSLLRG